MIRLRNILPIVFAVMVGSAILGAPSRACADFKVVVTDSVNTYNFDDIGHPGVIFVNIHDAAYNLIGSISTTNSPGLPVLAQVDVGYNVNTTGTTGGLMTIAASANHFTQPSNNPL